MVRGSCFIIWFVPLHRSTDNYQYRPSTVPTSFQDTLRRRLNPAGLDRQSLQDHGCTGGNLVASSDLYVENATTWLWRSKTQLRFHSDRGPVPCCNPNPATTEARPYPAHSDIQGRRHVGWHCDDQRKWRRHDSTYDPSAAYSQALIASTLRLRVRRSGGTLLIAASASSTTQTLTVTKADQTISFGALTDKTYGDTPFDGQRDTAARPATPSRCQYTTASAPRLERTDPRSRLSLLAAARSRPLSLAMLTTTMRHPSLRA